jgi:hypothetical protein
MTKTNLAYINKTFDAVEAPDILTWAKTKATKIIGGFQLVDLEDTGRYVDIIRGERVAFVRQRDALKGRLEAAGVNALAFVPTKAWQQICRASKLLIITPNKDGAVKISTLAVKSARAISTKIIETVGWMLVVLAFVLPTWSMFYVFRYYPTYKWDGSSTVFFWIMTGSAGLVSAGIMVLLLANLHENGREEFFKKKISARILRKWAKNPRKLAEFFTEGYDGMPVPVILPTPPADAIEVLLKAQNFPLSVTLVPEAVRFVGVDKILLEENDKLGRLEQAESRRQWAARKAAADPIVTTQNDSVVAVIIQFGDFPIEEEVVNAVAKTDYMH